MRHQPKFVSPSGRESLPARYFQPLREVLNWKLSLCGAAMLVILFLMVMEVLR